MGLRFSKRIKLFKGVHLNLSKSGISTSIGPRGAKLNIGKRGTYGTVGIPGSGLSYRTKIGGRNSAKTQSPIMDPENAPLQETPKKRSGLKTLFWIVVIGGFLFWLFS